jgi:hypothetical protein
MKNLIKNILKEGDWDWDFIGSDELDLPMALTFDPPITDNDDYLKIAKFLEDEGFMWRNSLGKPTGWSPIDKGEQIGGIDLYFNKKIAYASNKKFTDCKDNIVDGWSLMG